MDWKWILALGGSAVAIIFASKMDSATAERVSTHIVDTIKELAVASHSNS